MKYCTVEHTNADAVHSRVNSRSGPISLSSSEAQACSTKQCVGAAPTEAAVLTTVPAEAKLTDSSNSPSGVTEGTERMKPDLLRGEW